MDHGQGHGTTFKQILAEKLGIDPRLIRYRYGDTDLVAMGIGTFGSRSAILAGSAIVVAADHVIDKGRRIAAHLMEAAADDVVFETGRFKIAGTDRSVDLGEVARKSFHIDQLPKGMEVGLSAQSNFGNNQTATFACGFHVCEVEVDPDTGKVALVRYAAVDDVGTVLNPLLCDGQIYGGIGQGAGQALLENIVYDDSGQCLTASFMDYCMPRADDFCDFDLAFRPVPTQKNPLGVKGAGEAGTVSAIPAIVNAVNDALARVGAPAVGMPTTPEKVWRALRAAAH
jgi:carbon-monoxide dehydrogenase large subunit